MKNGRPVRRPSTTNKKPAVTSSAKAGSAPPSLLSRDELRAINRLVDTRSLNASRHGTISPSSAIPPIPLESDEARLGRANEDEILCLAVHPIHPEEGALDVPLRFVAPASMHAPVLEDPPSKLPLARRVTALLQGAENAPMQWRPALPGSGNGGAPSTSAIAALHDAETRIQSTVRAGNVPAAARLYSVCAALHYNYGNMEKAITHWESALHLYEQLGSIQEMAYCHNVIGICYFRQGVYKMALVHHTKQESLGECYARAVAEVNMGVSYSALGELEFAQQAFADAVENAEACGQEVLSTIALGNLGLTALRAGDMRVAQSNLEQCLESCSISGDKSGASMCLLLLGEVYAQVEDYQHALFYFEHAYRVGGEANNRETVALARVHIGLARGNAALRDVILAQAAAMGSPNSVEKIVQSLPQ